MIQARAKTVINAKKTSRTSTQVKNETAESPAIAPVVVTPRTQRAIAVKSRVSSAPVAQRPPGGVELKLAKA